MSQEKKNPAKTTTKPKTSRTKPTESKVTPIKLMNEKCKNNFGCEISEATKQQVYKTICMVVRDILAEKNAAFKKKVSKDENKQVFYMSMEFLVGTSLRNNLFNLKMEKAFRDALCSIDIDIDEIYKIEPDAGLGNGGLGRLASCYMDSLTSLGISATGYSIRYEFGIFRQKIVDGWQMEFPDDWLGLGDVWLKGRTDEAVEVRFGGRVNEWFDENGYHADHVDYNVILAVPYDMMISGYDTEAVNKLVLWSAKSPKRFDMTAFSRGDYAKAIEDNTKAEVISKVLYPADDHIEGKILRIKQQYFFVSASLQTIVKKHYTKYKTLDNLADKVSVHINDTHPALCVPELMRILMDSYNYGWDNAWAIACKTLSYTNHTVMSEALERWSESMFKQQLPRIYQIVAEINRRLLAELNNIYPGDNAKIEYMSIIANGEIRMSNLCLACCHTVNGVSKLHSEILTQSIFKDYFNIAPEKFTNVTNGIAYRRWLCQSNPLLTDFLKQTIGDGFIKDSTHLDKLLAYKGDKKVLDTLSGIKHKNKMRLADYILHANGIKIDSNSIFDVQVKRLHEYKRQLLNVLHILHMYRTIKENPNANYEPRTFIFAAKASAGYFMAKQIIRLICAVSNTINSDPVVRDILKVVFIEDYKVSLAEIIIPAADISEQISIAGKEASGTGNMKFMINGAVTLGTLDGANVEIFEQVGDDNMFLFGLKAHEVDELWRMGYSPLDYMNTNSNLKAVIDMLTSNVLGTRFDDIAKSLLTNAFGTADAYMTLADFESYVKAQERVNETYKDRYRFSDMSLVNIAKSGIFSSDRSIKEYAKNIWRI